MTFGSLFSGIGGMDLGLERAGMECRWQVEIDPYCNRVLEKHWPKVKRYGDIRGVTGPELERVDCIAGGFPCQDLSQAGKRVGIEGVRSGLWFEFARLVGELRPRYVLIENVPGLLVHDAMRRVVGELARLGYVGCWLSLRASDFGASHLRKRIFIVAYSGEAGNGRGDPERRGEQLADSADIRSKQLRPINGSAREGETEGRLCESARNISNLEHANCGRFGEPNARREQLADSSNGQLQVEGRGSERGNGAGSASAGALVDAARSESESLRWEGGRLRGRGIRQPSESLGTFAPGPSDPRWPAILRERPDLAPALGGRLGPRFVSWLMGFPVTWTELDDADAEKDGPDKKLRCVQEPVGTQADQRKAGGSPDLSQAQVLRSDLHGERPAQARPDTRRLSKANRAPVEESLRTVRNLGEAADASPQGSELAERRPDEHPDPVLNVPYLLASCRRGDCSTLRAEAVPIMRSSGLQEKYLRHLSNEDQALWSTLTESEREDCLVESVAWAASMRDRTKRLGTLGNAVVPDCAEWVGARILAHASAQVAHVATSGRRW